MSRAEIDAAISRHADTEHLYDPIVSSLTGRRIGNSILCPRRSRTRAASSWFIDTAYNDEAFFVRHAYFTGGDDPYTRLKTALRAEIDEAARATLNSTVSRPFPRPASGKIAVKVINHYGDEVMRVYPV